MGLRRLQATTSKLEIPEGTLKEIKLQFHDDIASNWNDLVSYIHLSLTWNKRLQSTYLLGGRHCLRKILKQFQSRAVPTNVL